MSAGCGGCTLCCTVMKVTMSEDNIKPARETCRHCTGKGCAIYEARPDVCQGFECVWLCSQRWPEKRLQSGLRPDRCGVVLEVNSKGNVVAHSATEASWKRDPIRKWLLDYARRRVVTIDLPGGEVIKLNADGSVEKLRFLDIDPATNERRYVRA